MNVLRTPDACFDAIDLPAPCYVDVPSGDGGTLRMACLDERPPGDDGSAPLVLLLHGEPTWSFLYRTVLPPLLGAGLRVVAPDLIGFGRSDKPAAMSDYTYARHIAWVTAFLDRLETRAVHLVCQDWGGLIGLRLVAAQPERFASVVAMNTALPTGVGAVPPEFLAWREASRSMPQFSAGRIVRSFCARGLDEAAMAAYDAPFPEPSYQAGARIFPSLVPVDPSEPEAIANTAAWEALGRFERPLLTLFGDRDPMTRGTERALQARVPGARGQGHAVLTGVGHFIQEDAGAEIGERIAAFVSAVA